MKKTSCPACGTDMTRLIAYWRCPSCGKREMIPRKGVDKSRGQ